MATRIWTEEEIGNLIQTNDRVLYNGLKKLYECQTVDEQRTESTNHHNGRGFNSADAKFLTSVAKYLLRYGYLSEKQKYVTRKRLVKYTRQLTRIANHR
jgi:hypothetical protein